MKLINFARDIPGFHIIPRRGVQLRGRGSGDWHRYFERNWTIAMYKGKWWAFKDEDSE